MSSSPPQKEIRPNRDRTTDRIMPAPPVSEVASAEKTNERYQQSPLMELLPKLPLNGEVVGTLKATV